MTYSGKMEIGGGGIGTTAWHQAKPLYDEGMLKRIYATGIKKLPKSLLHKVPVVGGEYVVQDIAFDGYVALAAEYPEILQSWASHCLFTLKAFPRATVIVNLYSAHIKEQAKILDGELGVRMVNPVLEKKVTKELQMCDHIFIPSEWVYKSLRKHGLEHKAKIVPFGVNLEKFAPPSQPREDDTFRAIYVGSNWIRKGLFYLLLAWKDLNLSKSELIVAGVDQKIEQTFKNLNLSNVKWGWVPDLAKSYQESDIFVLPALEDGAPLACYEALACGLPVIISENTGTYQHVHDGTNGFVVPIRDPKAIAERIRWLYDNRNQARKMGRNARKMAEAFPWERHEKEYIKWVKSL